MDKFLQATGYYTIEILKTAALVSAVWNGSPMGQALNPYFARAPQAIEQVSSEIPVAKNAPKCITIDKKTVCEKR